MKFSRLHGWPTDIREAVRIQDNLRHFVEISSKKQDFSLIAGADTAYSKRDDSVFAAVVVMKFPELVTLDKALAQANATFPYKPGLLAFREGPVLLKALERLQVGPDVIMFSANGIAHEKGIGLATHLGLLLDLPCLGCATKKLIGEHAEPENEMNAVVPLLYERREIGKVIRTRVDVKPLVVSVGHRVDLATAVELVSSTTRGYRLPEPIRVAHILCNKMRRNYDNRLEQSGSRPHN